MMPDIGIKIGLEGEKAFSSALKDINSGLKLLSSEMRAVSSQFLDNNKSIESYTAKNQVLVKQIDAQKEKIDKLKQILQKSTEMYGENDKKTQAWATKLNIAEAELNKMQNQLRINNSELDKYSSFSENTASSVGKLDKEIGTLQSDLEGVDKKYKRNKNSAEALGEKQRILTEIFSKQSEKVTVLKEALKNSENAFGKGSNETKKFEKALKDAEQELSGTERELENVKLAMQGASNSTRTFKDTLKAILSAEAITAGIRKLGETVKNFKNYIMGGIQSAAGFGREMSAMSEKTGISTEVLQKFSAAAKMTEVDVETFTKSYSKSIKSMSSVDFDAKNLNSMSKAYKTLGVNVRDSSGNLRDAQTVFWETIDGLKNMQNETERNAIALQIFGKSAMELNPIIKRGSEGFNDLTKNIATFDDQTMESLRGLDVSFQKFSGVMDGVKRSIGVAFAPMMKEIADAAANAGGKLKGLFTAIAKGEDQETINKKFEEFKNSIIKLSEKIREQMPLFIDIGGKIVEALWEGLKTAFEPILPQVIGWGALIAGAIIGWQALISVAVATLTPIITAVFSAIGPLIAAAVAAWPITIAVALAGLITFLTIKFWPQIKEWATGLWNNITQFFSEHWKDVLLWVISWPVALIKTLNDAGVWERLGNWLSGIWDNIKNWFSDLGRKISEWSADLWNSFMDFLYELPKKINQLLSAGGNGIKEWFSNLCQKISEWSMDVWASLLKLLSELPEKIGYFLGFVVGSIVKFFKSAKDAFVKFLKDAWDFVTVDIPKIITEMIDWFSKLPEKIGKWLEDTTVKIQNFGKSMGEKAKEVGQTFAENITTFFSSIPKKIGGWLSDVSEKVKSWVTDISEKSKEAGRTFLQNITDFFKELPGKIGKWLSDTIEKVKTWVTNMAEKAREMGSRMYENIVKTLQELPGRVYQIGRNIVEGIWKGISDMTGWISNKIRGFCDNFTRGFKKALGISSPSKLFKEQIGKNLALGIEEGFRSEMPNVLKSMNSAIPTDFDLDLNRTVDSTIPQVYSPNRREFTAIEDADFLISAFQSALKGMAFQIDGDKMGEMVISKVERVVFA